MTAVRILKRENSRRYGELVKSIRAQCAFDIDLYPKTLNTSYKLMENRWYGKVKYEEYRGHGTGQKGLYEEVRDRKGYGVAIRTGRQYYPGYRRKNETQDYLLQMK